MDSYSKRKIGIGAVVTAGIAGLATVATGGLALIGIGGIALAGAYSIKKVNDQRGQNNVGEEQMGQIARVYPSHLYQEQYPYSFSQPAIPESPETAIARVDQGLAAKVLTRVIGAQVHMRGMDDLREIVESRDQGTRKVVMKTKGAGFRFKGVVKIS